MARLYHETQQRSRRRLAMRTRYSDSVAVIEDFTESLWVAEDGDISLESCVGLRISLEGVFVFLIISHDTFGVDDHLGMLGHEISGLSDMHMDTLALEPIGDHAAHGIRPRYFIPEGMVVSGETRHTDTTYSCEMDMIHREHYFFFWWICKSIHLHYNKLIDRGKDDEI